MENGTNSDYLDKNFDCYEIDWLIENFCIATCGDKWAIVSPEFTIKGIHSTTWTMILHCEKCDSGDILRLTIKRSLTDAGPEFIWVDWRSTIPGFTKKFGLDSLMTTYEKGMACSSDIGSFEDVIKIFNIFESDSLTIHSKLIFFCEEDRNRFEPCADSGVKAFSDKLLLLFRNKKHHDLKLKFVDEEKCIFVHKVVVNSRIKELNYLLENAGTREEGENGEYDVLDLPCLNYEAMMRVLQYTYSGDLKFVFELPSFEIYDIVNKLQISELKPFFIPNKLSLRTSVDCQEFNFTWIIPDLKDLLKKESITSPLFTDGCSHKVFQIQFAQKKECYADFYGLHIRVNEYDERQNACFECAIADENNSYFFLKRSRVTTEDTEIYGFNKYIRRNMVKYFADQKCLRIIVRLRLSKGLMSSCIEKHNVTFTDVTASYKCFELLSNSLLATYETGLFTDAEILVSGTFISLHKSILYARCAKLYILVNQAKELTEHFFAQVEPRIFHMVMKYVYTGTVYNNESVTDVTDIYDLAADLRLSFLKTICSTFMQVLIQDNLGIREKVAAVAEKYKDEGLLEALNECISVQEEN